MKVLNPATNDFRQLESQALTVDPWVRSIKSTWVFQIESSHQSVAASPSKFSVAVGFITSRFKLTWEIDLTQRRQNIYAKYEL